MWPRNTTNLDKYMEQQTLWLPPQILTNLRQRDSPNSDKYKTKFTDRVFSQCAADFDTNTFMAENLEQQTLWLP